MNAPSAQQQDTQPWWRYGHLWMVIGGPAIVVVASFVTLYLAIRTPDPINPTYNEAPANQAANLTPAMQARNNAATGGVAPAKAPSPPPAED